MRSRGPSSRLSKFGCPKGPTLQRAHVEANMPKVGEASLHRLMVRTEETHLYDAHHSLHATTPKSAEYLNNAGKSAKPPATPRVRIPRRALGKPDRSEFLGRHTARHGP